jgi:hypothetical protein
MSLEPPPGRLTGRRADTLCLVDVAVLKGDIAVVYLDTEVVLQAPNQEMRDRMRE